MIKKFISKKEIQIISSIRNSKKTKCLRNHFFDRVKIINGKKIRYCSKCITLRNKKYIKKNIEKMKIEKNSKFQFFGVIQ
jgi:hypothetical protein